MTVKWSSTGARSWPAVTWLGAPVALVRRRVRLSAPVLRARSQWAHPAVSRAATSTLPAPVPVT